MARTVTVEFDPDTGEVMIQVLGGKGRVPPTVILTPEEAADVAARIHTHKEPA